ncbi:NAD-dependent epimerase/dehydratase family protein [Galbitalea sp. SE-J8]|uniref:NAD-dependent epimerase/dehydratase family protein n=1 Tax=Galbitalea sp. SE-J8 TaxID=3054952 RepID=UPI00259CB5CE|nr:NAD-dependent epimerase/dehydratase family protein [Galbitalea sp. SE-J8]MDM4762960.1 NAD-dependent epimerase/dehydratase family protein [Galbitalea sp. SE-J8]
MRVLLTGAGGMLGTAIAGSWAERAGGHELVPVTRDRVDLRDPAAVRALLEAERPDVVIHAAARVGGIADKLDHPASYLLDNVAIDSAVIGGSIATGVPRLLYVSSAAGYPEDAAQPIGEDALLTGPLEPANEPYGLAKLLGARLTAFASREHGLAYRTVVPSNLYGPGESYGERSAHLIASALRKVHAAHVAGAASVEVWGDGTARREFTFSRDLADWLVASLGDLDDWPASLNVGAGDDRTVREYYEIASAIVGYTGGLAFDPGKPAGVPRRLLDSSAARALGWHPRTSIEAGMRVTYARYLDTITEAS